MSLRRWTMRIGKAARLAGHPAYRRALRHGVGAAIEHAEALRPLGLAALVDVGANKGQFSLLARALFPQAVIHAFEPLEEAAATFRRVLGRDPGITLHPLALGPEAGSAEFHVSGHTDSSSLLPITARQHALFPGTAEVAIRSVSVERGDDVLGGLELPRPLLVKLDVQGFELAVLEGMPNVLARTDFICAEISFVDLFAGQPLADDVIAYLHPHGFRLADVYNLTVGAGGMAIQADALFRRR